MFTRLRRGALLGLGAISLTREMAQELATDLEARGRIDRKSSRKFVQTLVARGERERADLRGRIRKEMDAAIKRAGLTSAPEVTRLAKRVAVLEGQTKKRRGKAATK